MTARRTALTRRSALGLLAAVSGGAALTACGSSSSGSSDGGGAGSALTLYTSEPQEKIDELIAAFAKTDKGTDVEVFRAGTGELTTRIESEKSSGSGIQADILLAADAATFEKYVAEDLLLQYAPAEADALNPEVVHADGFYTGTRIIPTVIAYNSSTVDAPPASWADLGDPSLSGKIVMPNPDVSGAAAYNAAVWYTEPSLGEKWLTDLSANKPVIAESNGPVSQAVAQGTQPIGIVVDYLVRELKEQGSPVELVYPSEGAPYVSQPIGIFASTKKADAAKAFVDFVLSQEGQKIAVEQSYLPVRSDVGTPEGAPAMDEISLLAPDLATIQENQEAALTLFREKFQA